MLAPSPAANALIKHYEGLRLKAYPDPATGGDPWTIGVGHTGPEVHRGLVWTSAQVDAALTNDLQRLARTLNALIGTARTKQHQFDAMISLMFNIGPGNFSRSSVLANHLHGRYPNAAAAFLLWNKSGKPLKPMAGLTNRRRAEADLYLS